MIKLRGIAIILLLLGCIVGAVVFGVRFVLSDLKSARRFFIALIWFAAVVAFAIIFWPYINPVDQSVDFVLIEELDIPEEYTMVEPRFWYAVYDEFGLYASSRYNPPNGPMQGVSWPEMDLKRYTYIVCFGQKLDNLKYNTWVTIDAPTYTGAYRGYAEFTEDFYPNSVFIYRIQKMRIDNDP